LGALIAYLLVNRDAKKNEISFSCSSEFSSSLDIHKSKMDLEGILLITSYHSGYFSLSVQGSLKAESGQYVVDRKLFFRYSRPLGHAAGVYAINPSGREKSPDDNAPDAIDYLFLTPMSVQTSCTWSNVLIVRRSLSAISFRRDMLV
jgi:hypothetical protein